MAPTCFIMARINRGRSLREYGASSPLLCGWFATDVRYTLRASMHAFISAYWDNEREKKTSRLHLRQGFIKWTKTLYSCCFVGFEAKGEFHRGIFYEHERCLLKLGRLCWDVYARTMLTAARKSSDNLSAITSQLFQAIWLAKCRLTFLELNWYQQFWDWERRKYKFVVMCSPLPHNCNFVERTGTKRPFFVVKYANLRRRDCLSSLVAW